MPSENKKRNAHQLISNTLHYSGRDTVKVTKCNIGHEECNYSGQQPGTYCFPKYKSVIFVRKVAVSTEGQTAGNSELTNKEDFHFGKREK